MNPIFIYGCKSHGNLELGFYAAEQLLSLKPKDPETYVLLLNMYLSAERFEDVSRVRKMMEEEKVGKLKDWSCNRTNQSSLSTKLTSGSCGILNKHNRKRWRNRSNKQQHEQKLRQTMESEVDLV